MKAREYLKKEPAQIVMRNVSAPPNLFMPLKWFVDFIYSLAFYRGLLMYGASIMQELLKNAQLAI